MRQLFALFLAVAACDVPSTQITQPTPDLAPMSVDDGTRVERIGNAAVGTSSVRVQFGTNFTLPWDSGLMSGRATDDNGAPIGGGIAPLASWVCQGVYMYLRYKPLPGQGENDPALFIQERTTWPTAVTIGSLGPCGRRAIQRCEYKYPPVTVVTGRELQAWIMPTDSTGQWPNTYLYPPKTFTLPQAAGTYALTVDQAGPWLDKPWWRHWICDGGFACGDEWYADGSTVLSYRQCTPVAGVCRQPCAISSVTW